MRFYSIFSSANFWTALGAKAANKKPKVIYIPSVLLASFDSVRIVNEPKTIAAMRATKLINLIEDLFPLSSEKNPTGFFLLLESGGGEEDVDVISVSLTY